MKPRSLSATALEVAAACPARYYAEQIERGRAIGSSAATLGTTVHSALEQFVKLTRPELGAPKLLEPTLDNLMVLYHGSFLANFGTSDPSLEEYDDGIEMLKRWFARTSWDNVTVLSAERKDNFSVPTSIGEIPFNYIWDRCDRIGEYAVKVVDYKTNRRGLRPEDLRDKVQARCYGVAAAIFAKSAGFEVREVWVEFDLLRHDPVGIVFSRKQNAATWKFIKDEAQRIVDTDPTHLEERPNPGCGFCVRKTTCGAFERLVSAGGVFSLSTFEEQIDRRARLAEASKALNNALAELDTVILAQAEQRDITAFDTDTNHFEVTMSARKATDAERVAVVVGDQIFQEYGGLSLTMAQFNQLLKDKRLTEEQKRMLKGLVYQKHGDPRVSTSPRNPIDE